MIGRLLGAGALLAAVVAAPPLAASDSTGPAVAAERTRAPQAHAVVYRPPVAGRLQVLRGFSPPRTRYGAGHLGVDIRAAVALAAGDGVVTYAGPVAGRGVVVVAHADGIRTEYEPLSPSVHAGEHVRAGQLLGAVAGSHRGCPGRCLHWGARGDDRYLDPLTLLHPLGPVRLLPWSREQP